MRAYTELLVRTCHKRGAHAIGGMAAFIPSKDEEVNEAAFAKVRDDKTREAGDGFDGSWVAHPGMVPLCTRGLRRGARRPAQPARPDPRGRARHRRAAARRARAPPATVTEAGLRNNISVGMQYLEAWLRGIGAVGDQQPDGGRRHRRDLPVPGVAVAAQRRRARPTAQHGHPRAGRAARSTRRSERDPRGRRRRGVRARAAGTRRAALFTEMALADDFADFLTLPGLRADAMSRPGRQ